MRCARASLAVAVLWLSLPTLLPAVEPAAPAPLLFNRDIRPILADNCFACHGPDSASRKAGLRLDREADAFAQRKDGTAIVPGDLEKSLAFQRITSKDPSEIMPPPETKKVLKPEQIDVIRRWIAAGAKYEVHWSFIAPERPALPAVKREAWVRNPIDRFVLAELERVGLEPAPEADRRALARRATLDITGLPPEPELVEAFVGDGRADAYDRLLDKLFDSKHWGEHRARYWLDAARYADTHGLHFDNFREMWSFREWVIGAFNRNLPFDELTVEQLAGDLLPDRTLDQLIASGFNRCNITTNEGGAIDEEYRVLYARDRTETTAQVWLGLTAGCATCHDHKFDPLTQREFYQLSAFFNNTTQNAMDGNIKDTPPIIPVPRPEDRTRWDALDPELTQAKQKLAARRQEARGDFERWLVAASPATLSGELPVNGLKLRAPLDDGDGSSVKLEIDGQGAAAPAAGAAWEAGHVASKAFKATGAATAEIAGAGDFEKDQPFTVAFWVKLPRQDVAGSLLARMDDADGKGFRGWDVYVERGRVGMHLVHRWSEDALKLMSQRKLEANRWTHLAFVHDGSGKPGGIEIYFDGERQDKRIEVDALKGSIRTDVSFKLAQRQNGSRVGDIALQDLRLYDRALAAGESAALARGARAAFLAGKPAAERSAQETEELLARWLETVDAPYREAAGAVAALEKERAGILARGTVAHVWQERSEMPEAYILFRGEYDKRRDKVEVGTPAFLPAFPAAEPRNRLGLARWLMSPQNPLTARVTANRFWQEVFGTGIVRTVGDLGTSGELPSHPELLDWLAVELRDSGWDVKGFFRLLLTSASYRQAATATPEKMQKDPQSRLLSRGPRFRMDAEVVRDFALAASGLLVRKIGGPSVKPYQPDGVWEAVAMPESNTKSYQRDSGESLYRRSLYTFWKRAAPPASMEILNAPAREVCTVRRERTNTPLQALVTLNDPQFVEAARQLAQRAIQGGATVEARLDHMARRLLSRPFPPEELAVVQGVLDDLLAHYRGHPRDAADLLAVGESKAEAGIDAALLAAYTMTANQLFNLDEVLNK